MADLQLTFGTDLSIDASGDIALSDGTQEGQERVIRRLLTNGFEYIWHPTYGAGLARFLGSPTVVSRIAGVTRAQMFREAIVKQNPPPSISVTTQQDGSVFLSIRYVDADTAQQVVAQAQLGGPDNTA
jgi:hypothetical protein